MAEHIPFLRIGRRGRVGALDYVIGTILVFLAWLFVQAVFQGPVSEMDSDAAADASAEMLALADSGAMDAMMTPDFGFGVLAMLVGVFLAPIAYIVSRLTDRGVAKAFRIASWVGVALLALGLFVVLPIIADAMSGMDMSAALAVIGSSPVAYGLTLASFAGGIGGVLLVTRFLHGRTLTSAVTAARRIRWSRMFWVMALTLGLWALIQGGMVLLGLSDVAPNPRASQILPFLVATILFIPIQCAAEELMFRGYLNQALARFIPSVVVVFALSSLAFGALHLANPEIAAAKAEGTFWLTFGFYVLFGAVFSVLVWIDNGLEAAIGVHTANNAFVATFINIENSALPVPSLYIAPLDSSGASGLVALASCAAVILAVWVTRRPAELSDEVLAGTDRANLVNEDPRDADTLDDIFSA